MEIQELVGPEHELPMKDLMKNEVEQPQRYEQGRDAITHLFVTLVPSCWNNLFHSGDRNMWNILK